MVKSITAWVWKNGVFIALVLAQMVSENLSLAGDADRETLLLAIASNNELMGAVQFTIREEVSDLTVTDRKAVKIKSSNGEQISYELSPNKTSYRTVVVETNQLRLEVLNDQRGVVTSMGFDGSQWTEYDSTRNVAVIRRPQDLAGLLPFDPREIVAFDIREPLESLLQLSVVTPPDKPDAANDQGEKCFVAECLRVKGNPFKIKFDPECNLLPVESFLYFSDGSLLRHTRVTYQAIATRGAQVLESAVTNFYAVGDTLSPDPDVIKKVKMVYVEELLLLPDSEKPTVSVVEIPPSVKIIDYTKRPVTQGPETVTSSHVTPARRTALLLINGLVLVCALGLWVFRSCRRKRS